DHISGADHAMDTPLFDLLHDLRLATGAKSPFQVICGYRSPSTNAMLRAASTGVARHSLHMEGRAIDIRVAGVKTTVLRDAALAPRRGGVGSYAFSVFIHADRAPARRW